MGGRARNGEKLGCLHWNFMVLSIPGIFTKLDHHIAVCMYIWHILKNSCKNSHMFPKYVHEFRAVTFLAQPVKSVYCVRGMTFGDDIAKQQCSLVLPWKETCKTPAWPLVVLSCLDWQCLCGNTRCHCLVSCNCSINHSKCSGVRDSYIEKCSVPSRSNLQNISCVNLLISWTVHVNRRQMIIR